MRSVLDFYRARPVVGVLVFVVGLAIAVATTTLQKGDGIVLPVAFTALMGILVGSVVALGQRNRRAARDAELEAALDAAEAEPHAPHPPG
jgi:NhaP-type Na+/H+ or K+/H+ antiporter